MVENVFNITNNGGSLPTENIATLITALYAPIAQTITKQTVTEMLPEIVKQVVAETQTQQGTTPSQVDEKVIADIVDKKVKSVKTHTTTKMNEIKKLMEGLVGETAEIKKFLADPTGETPKALVDLLSAVDANKTLIEGQGAAIQGMDKKLDLIIEEQANLQAAAQPAQPAVPVNPVVEPVQPATPVSPVETVNPVNPVQPVQQEESVQQEEPVQPAAPVNPVNPVQPAAPVVPVQPVDPAQPVQPVAPIAPVEEPVSDEGKKRWLKGKLLNGLLKRTNMLSEPRRPFFKRLKSFAVNHPILTALTGAGIGLLGVGAAVGIGAASHVIAGGIGIGKVLAIFAPNFALGAGIGAVAGGVTSFVGRLFPGAKTERLIHKFRKREKAWEKISAKAEHLKGKEFEIEEQRKEVRAKIRESKGIARWINKTHDKILRRTSRKYRWKAREAVYKIKPAAISALEAKYELNMHENRRGKNEALAGYVGKMDMADAKLAKQNQKVADLFKQGKITAEERDARLADNQEDHELALQELAEDFEMIPGGAPGLEGVSRQTKTFDTEAERIAKTIADDPTAQKVLEEIAARNSKKEHEVVEAVYRDPEQLDAEIAEMKKDPAKAEEAKLAEAVNNSTKGRRKAYEQYAKDHGIAVEPEKLLTPEEVEAWKKHIAGRKKPEELPEDAPEKE